MSDIPPLTTDRLQLRGFTLADAPMVEQLAGSFAVADTTLNLPHPYPPGAAVNWINTHAEPAAQGTAFSWAITDRTTETLYGTISIGIVVEHQHAEIGYWMGEAYWGRGYTSEAARAVVDYGFRVHNLQRILARHFVRNPASGRVMQKIGMQYEGTLRQHIRKGTQFEDVACYGIIRSEWEQQTP